MLIGIDGNEANITKKVGISEYAYELLMEFHKLQGKKFQIYLKNGKNDDLPQQTPLWQYRILTPKKVWTQWRLPFDLFTHSPRPDVFFTPSHYAPRFSPVPTAIAIMDVAYLYFPEMFQASDLYQLKNWTSYSVKNAKAVFTISQSSKNDIIKCYNMPEDRIYVTYPGIKPLQKKTFLTMDTLAKKYGIGKQYILFVSTLQPRKNAERLIKAFAKMVGKHPELELILIGKKGWLYEDILAAPKKNNITEKVRFLDYVPDEDLPAFYTHALCFVLPSLYEGFGLGVVEAMKYNCPVITSNISSLPEAGGDAALYVDPKDVEDMAQKMLQVIENKHLREKMIEKGQKHIKKFSWERTAKETVAVLESIAKKQ